MAITKEIVYDKKEIVGEYAHLQIRKSNVIKEDGKELTRSFERFTLDPGTLSTDGAKNFVDNPLIKEPDGTTDITDEVKSICNIVWTQSVKDAWKAHLIAIKP